MDHQKVLAINGSPRGRKSNTDRLLQPFLEGAAEAGAVCESVYAIDLNVKECIGCYTCWKTTPGVCVFKDDMPPLLEKIRSADILVWATPVYHFGMNVRLRRIVERTLPTCKPYMVKKGGRYGHPGRYEGGPSTTVLIANCGFPDRSNFDQLVATFQKIAGDRGLAAAILCGGGELLGVEELKGRFDWYHQAVCQAGREIAEYGTLRRETVETLEQPLMPVELFVQFANASWNVEGETPPSPEELWGEQTDGLNRTETGYTPLSPPVGRNTARDMIAGMPAVFQPEVAPELTAVIQFDVTGEEPGRYFLKIAGGTCRAFKGTHPNPGLTIHTPSSVWINIAQGERDGMDALLRGEYTVEGDMNLMVRFGRLFESEKAADPNPDVSADNKVALPQDDIREVLKGMAGRFNPKQAPGLNAVFQFKISDGGQSAAYHLEVADGKCVFWEGSSAKPSLTVITPKNVWLAVARGELDGSMALMEGKYTYEGDLNLLIRMNSIFSGGEEPTAAQTRPRRTPGPVMIPGMQWLTVAFLPWIYFWVFSGSHRLSSIGIPLLLSGAILLYRMKYIEPTPIDIGSPIFFGCAVGLYYLFPQVLFKYGPVLGTLAQGLIWAATLITDKPLTAAYSKYNYPAGFEENPLFLAINAKITAFWVAIYIVQAVIAISAPTGAAYRSLWLVGSYILLIPAFVFTARFPEWYIKRRGQQEKA